MSINFKSIALIKTDSDVRVAFSFYLWINKFWKDFQSNDFDFWMDYSGKYLWTNGNQIILPFTI